MTREEFEKLKIGDKVIHAFGGVGVVTEKEENGYTVKDTGFDDSNDINSPTHYSDLEDCLAADLDDLIGDSERYMIQQKLTRIFEIIKRNK